MEAHRLRVKDVVIERGEIELSHFSALLCDASARGWL